MARVPPIRGSNVDGSIRMRVASLTAQYPISGHFPFTAATYTASTRTLTKTGAFTLYVHESGTRIYIPSGTGITGPQGAANEARWFEVESRTSNDAVVLKASPYLPASNQTDFAGWVLPNTISGNHGATSATASESLIDPTKPCFLEGVTLISSHTAQSTIEIMKADGTTVVESIPIAANKVTPFPVPLGLEKVLGGISAKSTVSAATSFDLFIRQGGL